MSDQRISEKISDLRLDNLIAWFDQDTPDPTEKGTQVWLALRELRAYRKEGWVLVPRECDDEMAKACRRQLGIEFGSNADGTLGYYKRIVNAALAAAPEPQEGG